MRTFTKEELGEILMKHNKWLNNEPDGEKADLSAADLSSANLRYANLSYANLSSANLSYANLSSANLRYANLSYANLIIFQYQRDTAFYTFDGALRIGCVFMPITEWIEGYKEIGQKHNYTEDQISMYGKFIEMCFQHFKESK